jgi:hypothetical protein
MVCVRSTVGIDNVSVVGNLSLPSSRCSATRETLHAIGGALIQAGAALQPHGCNGHVQPNGYFNTQYY